MSRILTSETLDAIAAAGFDVYQNPDPYWHSYALFTDQKRVGHIQTDFGGLRISTVNLPCKECGTGFALDAPQDLSRASLERAFIHAPEWAGPTDRNAVRKYNDWPHYARSQSRLSPLVPTRAVSEAARNDAFRAEPLLQDFISCALQDLQLTEADNACEDGRDERDAGTIYTLEQATFDRMAAIVARFRRECGEHIAAALALEPDEIRYRRSSKAGEGFSEAELGSTLWLALVGSGVTFTDDSNLPCLEALADWARANHREGLSFGDNGEAYLV